MGKIQGWVGFGFGFGVKAKMPALALALVLRHRGFGFGFATSWLWLWLWGSWLWLWLWGSWLWLWLWLWGSWLWLWYFKATLKIGATSVIIRMVTRPHSKSGINTWAKRNSEHYKYHQLYYTLHKFTHLNKLQKVQNYALRIALSLPVYTKIAALHTLGDCDTINERLNLLKSQAISRYQGSEIMNDMAIKTLLLKK